MIKKLIAISLLLVCAKASAVVEIFDFDTDSQRASYLKLSEELRCPKCQNQNLADSNSEIANIMRDVIAEELVNGKSEQDIKDLMVARYGDFVLYEPPISVETAILWWTPFVFLFFALLAFISILVRRTKAAGSEEQDTSESDELEASESKKIN